MNSPYMTSSRELFMGTYIKIVDLKLDDEPFCTSCRVRANRLYF